MSEYFFALLLIKKAKQKSKSNNNKKKKDEQEKERKVGHIWIQSIEHLPTINKELQFDKEFSIWQYKKC